MTIPSINSADKVTYNKFTYNHQIITFKGDDVSENSLIDTVKSMPTKEKAGWLAGIGTFFTSVVLLFKNLKKPSSGAKNITKSTKQLIKQLKPQDEELANKFYPVLIKNSEKLQIKSEDFNNIIKAVSEDNREFMVSEGIDIVADNAEKIKNITGNSTSDLFNIISAINKNNKKVFISISDNIERLKIADAEDFQTLLTEINPKKHYYMFSQLLPKIIPYETSIGINNPERYAKILNHIVPETESIIPEIAKFKTSDNRKIDKFGIIIATTKDNKDCLMPLLNNIEKFNYNSFEIKNILKQISNKNSYSIDVAANNSENLKKLNIKAPDIFKTVENKEQSEILNIILNNHKFFKIENTEDIKNYIKFLKPDNINFIKRDLVPKLKGNTEILGLSSPDQIIEILNNINPETISAIDIIMEYAPKLGANVSYSSLLGAVTKKNISNLPKFMQNIKNTEVWDNFMVNSKDFQKLLDSI